MRRRRRGRSHKSKEEVVSFVKVVASRENPLQVIGEFKAIIHRDAISTGVDITDFLRRENRTYTAIFNFRLPENIADSLILVRHSLLADGETTTTFTSNTTTFRIIDIERGVKSTRVIFGEGDAN